MFRAVFPPIIRSLENCMWSLGYCHAFLLSTACVDGLELEVCMEHLGFNWTDFYEIWYFRIFRKSVQKIQVSLKSDENKGYFTWWSIHILILCRSILLRMRNISDKSCKGNQNTKDVIRNFFRKSCRLWDNVEKYCTAGQGTYDNMVHAHCMLGT